MNRFDPELGRRRHVVLATFDDEREHDARRAEVTAQLNAAAERGETDEAEVVHLTWREKQPGHKAHHDAARLARRLGRPGPANDNWFNYAPDRPGDRGQRPLGGDRCRASERGLDVDGESVVMLGWSGGGPYALAASDRLGPVVQSVHLVSPLPGPLVGPHAVPDQSERLQQIADS